MLNAFCEGWENGRWTRFKCPLCGSTSYVQVRVQKPNGDWYLTEFFDGSFPRPGTDEVFFDRALDPSPVERPPNVVYEYREIPMEALIGAMCAGGAVLLVAVWLLVRRFTKPHR